MRILIAYDSAYGNTARIAHALIGALSGKVEVRQIRELDPHRLPEFDLLILGSPTQSGHPTAVMRAWLEALPPGSMAGRKVATFDTRLSEGVQSHFLSFIIAAVGYAAPRLDRAVRAKGADSVADPEGFIVLDREGPLKDGEMERATLWAAAVAARAQPAALAVQPSDPAR